MLELMQEMNAALESQTTPVVGLWMNWMGLIFLASIIFAWKRTGARIALITIFLTMISATIIYAMTENVFLFGIPHFLFWGPLLYYLVTKELRDPSFKLASPYGIWLILISATIVISLVFDARDLFLIFAGQK